MEKSLISFLLLFKDLKFGKCSLFCCNGYNHAIFTIVFYESQVKNLSKAITKNGANDFLIAVIHIAFLLPKLPKFNKKPVV